MLMMLEIVDSREEDVEKLGHEMLAESHVGRLTNRAQHTRSSVEALAK